MTDRTPTSNYHKRLTEEDLKAMEYHISGGWRLVDDFKRLIEEVRVLQQEQKTSR
jgi:hypothetical protein